MAIIWGQGLMQQTPAVQYLARSMSSTRSAPRTRKRKAKAAKPRKRRAKKARRAKSAAPRKGSSAMKRKMARLRAMRRK